MRKVAIVGTAPGADQCPTDASWERWAANWAQLCYDDRDLLGSRQALGTGHVRFTRVYELHDAMTRDAGAHAALRPSSLELSCSPEAEVWCFYVAEEWRPRAHVLDADELIDRFGSYFTNSIAWMLGHALYEHQQGSEIAEIGIFGVDMATAKEFGHERPSVEYMIGWARGMGIEVTIPFTSDLCHCSIRYGLDQETWYEHKLMAERLNLAERLRAVDPQERPYTAHALESALSEVEYLLRLRFHTRPEPIDLKLQQSIGEAIAGEEALR